MSETKYRNILITGGAGFIGSHITMNLALKGFNVTVLDNLSPQIHGADKDKSPLYIKIKGKARFIYGDVTNRTDLQEAMEGQDAIIHLAAETGTGQSMYSIEQYTKTNIFGTALIWDIIANEENSIKKFLIASSRAIYGEGKYLCSADGIVYPQSRRDEDMKAGDFNVKCPVCGRNVKLLPTSEDSLIHPASIYGLSKQVQEEMSMITGKSLKIPVVAFRYQNVYGPGQSLSNPYTGILSIFSTRIKNKKEIQIFEDGTESRDFVYIDDVVDATVSGLLSEKADNQSFNVGTGIRTSVTEVAETLLQKYGSDVPVTITGKYRLGDIRDNYADITKISKLLGFIPKTGFNEGIGLFAGWVDKQDIEPDRLDYSLEEMKRKGLYK